MPQDSLWFWVHLSIPLQWDHQGQDWPRKSLHPVSSLRPSPFGAKPQPSSPCWNPQVLVIDGAREDPGKERLVGEAGMLEEAHFSGLHKEERSGRGRTELVLSSHLSSSTLWS